MIRTVWIAVALLFAMCGGAFARDGCVAWESVQEPDIARNRAALVASDLCLTVEEVEEHARTWTLHVLTSARPGPYWVVLHDNEVGPFESGVFGVTTYGGEMIALETGENRLFGEQDPNGNFGAGLECKQDGPAPRYTEALLRRRRSGQPIVALHSNLRGYSGAGAVSISRPADGETPFRARAFPGAQAPQDTFIYVAGRTRTPSSLLRQQIAWLGSKRISVMYEHVTAAMNDCSLSNYAALNDLRPYFNIEVVDGDEAAQKRMIALLMEMLRP